MNGERVATVLTIALAGWVTLVWVCGAVYVAVTYAVAIPELPRRSLGATVRWALRESWLVLWSQPLMPLFQLFGQRMGGDPQGVPIVLVHGYFQNRVDFLYLARRLRRAGSGPLFAYNFFWPQRLETSSARMRRFVHYVQRVTGAQRVDLLTHSTGGLFALDLIGEEPEVVRKAVVIAIPARGVPWRGPVIGRSGSQLRVGSPYQAARDNACGDTPVLSIHSAHDNLVHPVTTSQLDGAHAVNLEVDGPGHLSVLFDKRVGDAVVDFLVP